MDPLIKPHGKKQIKSVSPNCSSLVNRFIELPKNGDEEGVCRQDLRFELSSMEISDLIMLGTGAYSPLKGFMTEKDYTSVVESMRLFDGTVWPLPVTLSADEAEIAGAEPGKTGELVEKETGRTFGIIVIEDLYRRNKEKEAELVCGTGDANHPGVRAIFSAGEYCIGGNITLFSEGEYPEKYPQYARPEETRALFKEKGWRKIAAFQTRNPIHRSHEYLTKIALETMDGLLIHPVVGRLKEGDIPADTRMACYEAVLDGYYPRDRVVLKVYPLEMRYAGPREALLHGIIRQNFGCSHIIIGRDHAGVGDYYGPYEAQDIFDQFDREELAIEPIKVDWTFWCYRCGQMASKKSCPHGKEDHLHISGTALREMLADGAEIPAELTRPEVAAVLKEYMRGRKQ